MNTEKICEWVDFCRGKTTITDDDHFSKMFYDLYSEPFTRDEVDLLTSAFENFENAGGVLNKILRLEFRGARKSNDELLSLVSDDLKQKRKFVEQVVSSNANARAILSVIDSGRYSFTDDHGTFQQRQAHNLSRSFRAIFANHFMRLLRKDKCDRKIRMLCDSFYGIAHDVWLNWALTANLLQLDVDFENFFELYAAGANYCIDDESIVILQS